MSLSERVTVTVPVPDLDFLKEYERAHGLRSRSAAFHAAIAALREKELESQYLEADEQWYGSDDAAAWDLTSGDGLGGDA
ncbi:antitoxin [Cellulomonas sp. ACRRI]|uniref:antitoxin n=1 Tax=Cellulomonas sp. ACRRI TaxID=2918188 RepID=UPI001EF20ED0|nr:antitoxin [Cellulomonas sp. ACRRI]MCG7284525.1 antitoxin [Cellulomonas sp. ACRRI]